jgi:hypothetical protein
VVKALLLEVEKESESQKLKVKPLLLVWEKLGEQEAQAKANQVD